LVVLVVNRRMNWTRMGLNWAWSLSVARRDVMNLRSWVKQRVRVCWRRSCKSAVDLSLLSAVLELFSFSLLVVSRLFGIGLAGGGGSR
jgi:hypothetical protein